MNSQVQYNQPAQITNNQQQAMNTQPIGDIIDQLPADKSVPSHNEIRIVDHLFQQKKGIVDKILHSTKDMLVLGALFIIFSLPLVDNLIIKFIEAARTSHYILIGIKTILFVFTYFIIENIYLARTQ